MNVFQLLLNEYFYPCELLLIVAREMLVQRLQHSEGVLLTGTAVPREENLRINVHLRQDRHGKRVLIRYRYLRGNRG